MRESLADFCRRTGREELLDEWDSERNLPLTPESVSYGSKRHVWWRCTNGHSWQAAVHTRSGGGTGCPYCNGRRAIPGETDLATRYPDIARQCIPQKTATSPRPTCSPAATVSSGGSVSMDTCGAPRSKAECPAPAAQFAAIAHSCAEKTTSLQTIPSSPASGTQPKMATSRRATSSPALGAKSGGFVIKAMNGAQPSPLASTAAVAQSAPARRSSPARTTSPASIQPLQPSGTQPRMAPSHQSKSLPPATKKSGGSATKATSIRPPSPAAPKETAAARTAPTPRCSPASTISPQNIRA